MQRRSNEIDTSCIGALLHSPRRFLRSTNLERDFADPRALDDYCLTSFGLNCLSSVAEAFGENSARRAWRFTGDYGTGKSSFALLLARCAQSARSGLPAKLRDMVAQHCPELGKRNFTPILVTGTRGPLGALVMRAMATNLPVRTFRSLPKRLQIRLRNAKDRDVSVTDGEVLQVLETVSGKLVEQGLAEGVLLILDECGKFLEYAALHPEAEDVLLLQHLAEFAQRSAARPFIIVCLFHVAFSAYAAQLSSSAQKEWEKVAGRFEEVPFAQPLEQVGELVAAALQVDTLHVPKALLTESARTAEQAYRLRWMGAGASSRAWQQLVPKLFPLDPMLLPVALRVFQRFAQHERSLFSFLFSHEPFGLRAFGARPLRNAGLLRLPEFFDYVRANLGQRISQISYRSHWSVVEAVVESVADLPDVEQRVLKTVALLNVLNTDDLRPTASAVVLAVAGTNAVLQKETRHALVELTKSRRLYFRGESRGYCVWPYSSVDLDKAFEVARREVPEVDSFVSSVQAHLPQRAIVARQHYIVTGNLRHFTVEYVSGVQLAERLLASVAHSTADGRILVALCQDEAERRAALEIAKKATASEDIVLVAITRPLQQLRGFVLEAQRWEWVATHTPGLNTDRIARDEVSRQWDHARDMLARKLSEFAGIDRISGSNTLVWFRTGEPLSDVRCGRDLIRKLSDLADEHFGDCGPRIHNELINRHSPSPAAAGARMRLIEQMLTQPDARQLGIPDGKHPPEMSMYLSVLQATRLHREERGVWGIHVPANGAEDPCNVRHSFNYLRNELEKCPDSRVPIAALYTGLAKSPYGVRRGLMPLFIAVFFTAHAHELAFYERGNFVADVNGDMFQRLIKVPEVFDLQWCHIDGLRSQVLEQLRQVVALPPAKSEHTRLLEIVRPLCAFAVELPDYTKRTRQISAEALAVREVLFNAKEPVRFLLHQLPIACGLQPFAPDGSGSAATAQAFVRKLHDTLRQLNGAYSQMLRRLEKRIAVQFRLGDDLDQAAREQIIRRAKQLRPRLREPRLVAFTNALGDPSLSGEKWVSSIASILAQKTPATWVDGDEVIFDTELTDFSGRFLRVEHMYLGEAGGADAGRCVRVSITQGDGDEVAEVLHLSSADDTRLSRIEKRLDDLITREGDVALIAAARQLGRRLSRKESKS